jgi:hypothetical protein
LNALSVEKSKLKEKNTMKNDLTREEWNELARFLQRRLYPYYNNAEEITRTPDCETLEVSVKKFIHASDIKLKWVNE